MRRSGGGWRRSTGTTTVVGMRLPVLVQFTVLLLVGWVSRQQQDVIAYLREELAVLRELHGNRLVLTDAHRRRLARAGKRLGRSGLAEVATLFTPDTILRWYRDLVARKYDGDRTRRRRARGRPKTAGTVADLVCRLAEENVRWGYTSLRDRLHHLGHDLGRSTVARILAERGIVPAPERSRTTRWTDFLAAHAGTLCSADFFSAEVLTWAGVVRFQVLFVLRVSTRRVELVGIRRDPSTGWMVQLARNLTDVLDGFLRGMRYLILDRDPLYSRPFRDLLESAGVKVVRLPRESPNLNAHAERWVRSVRRELLDHLVLVGEDQLRRVVRSYVEHYNTERPHQGLGGAFVDADPRARNRSGRVVRHDRLGGLLRFYHRAAA